MSNGLFQINGQTFDVTQLLTIYMLVGIANLFSKVKSAKIRNVVVYITIYFRILFPYHQVKG